MHGSRRTAASSDPIQVFIVDDSPVERAIVKRHAEASGHRICGEAGDLPAALSLLLATSADVVVIDGRITPQIAEAIAALRKQGSANGNEEQTLLRIIVIASLEERELARRAIAAGAAGALLRPVLLGDFTDALARLARTPPAGRE